ncbi:Beclin-1 [Mactra antiquata]
MTTVPAPPTRSVEKSKVSFVCQRCRQPLKIDLSFDTIEQQSELVRELTAPLIAQVEREETLIPEKIETYEEDSNISKRLVPPRYPSVEDDSNGFTLLGETGPKSLGDLGHKPKVKAVLFDIMTGQSTVDHPLCEECTDTLLNQLDDQLKITEEECRDYRNFLEKLETNVDNEDNIVLDDELQKLKAEEEVLRQQLKQVELEQKQIISEIQKEKETTKKLEEEEERYWREYNEHKRRVQELDDEERSVDNQLKFAQAQLDRLKKTNVFNATFHIWHSGHFGTINNFRLGRLPSQPVEWSEINAAWGQTVLLLHSLAKKMNLTFQRYRLVPYGNHSYIESLSDKSKELPLYASGGFRFFWDAKFDQAMVAFLDCLQQFKEEVERGDSQFCLPYKMDKGKIGETSGSTYSIKIQFNSEEQWTKALKYMLTNLKWGLAWVSSQFANK